MKSVLRDIVCFVDRNNLHGRYKDARNDLEKGLVHSCPITSDEKQDILSFWKPYKNSLLAKYCWNIRWYDLYKKTNKFNFELKYYIPDNYYYCILDTHFNNPVAAEILDDKNLYDLLLHDVPQPQTVFHKIDGLYLDSNYQIISEADAKRMCLQYGKVILKPSINSCSGSGINVYDCNVNDSDELSSFLRSKPSFVCQEYLHQSSFMSTFCSSCVNTIRIITILFQGEIHVTTSVLIMGGEGAGTNHLHRGGIVCGIHQDGRLFSVGFDRDLNEYTRHPSGVVFDNCVIPNYYKVLNLVKQVAPRLGHISKMIAWDIAFDEKDEPVLIETNLTWGGSVQIAAGPVFGDMTKDILDAIIK